MRRIGSVLGALGLGLVASLALSEMAARIVMPDWRDFSTERFLKVTTVPPFGSFLIGQPDFNGRHADNNGDYNVEIRLNRLGLRNDEPPEAADGRVWVLGDSFAFGWGVDREQTVAVRLESQIGDRTYLVASPGANLCGYLGLTKLMLPLARPKAVLLMLTLENDVAAYECGKNSGEGDAPPVPTGMTLPNLDNVKEALMKRSAFYNLVATAFKRSEHLRTLLISLGIIKQPHILPDGYSTAVSLAAMDQTTRKIIRLRDMMPPGTPFQVLLVPSRFDLQGRNPGETALRHRMTESLRERKIAVSDPFDALRRTGFDAIHFKHDGHWTSEGHAVAAREVALPLRALLTDLPTGTRN